MGTDSRRWHGGGRHYRSRPARARGPGVRRGARGRACREGGRALRGGRVGQGGVRCLCAARRRGDGRQSQAQGGAGHRHHGPLRRGLADAPQAGAGGAHQRGIPVGCRLSQGPGSGGRLMAFIPHTEADVAAMLATIGAAGIENLFDEIPPDLRVKSLAGVPPELNEMEIGRLMTERARADGAPLAFIGAGAYEHHIPAAAGGIHTRREVYTAYTPYPAEASPGTLQPVYEFPAMVARLTGMEVANASMYDGASATAEAALMAVRANRKSKSARILVPTTVHPHYRRGGGGVVATHGGRNVARPRSPRASTVPCSPPPGPRRARAVTT